MKHFAFTGTHSTGKTTVLEALQSNSAYNNYKFYKSVTRKVGEKTGKLNTQCDSNSQRKMIESTVEYYDGIIKDGNNSIEDRCFVDSLAYNKYFYSEGLIDKDTYDYCLREFEKKLEFHNFIFYFKTEFDNVLDGTRIDDKDFRACVEQNIEHILHSYKMKFIIITGTVEERVQQIDRVVLELCT